MIPKQLFFIWIGDKQPNYVDFSINTFRKVNPDFKIDFLKYTINDIENLDTLNKSQYDIDLINIRDIILNNNNYHGSLYRYKQRLFTQKLCNILRLELLSKYGGIYLDCDTFPVKPFDDNILSKESFHVMSYNRNNQKKRQHDCFFLGSVVKNNRYDCFRDLVDTVDCGTFDYLQDKKWNDNKKHFYNCTLEYNKMDYSYIEHFCDFTWNPNNLRTYRCKYDK